jgi:predicted metal-dependent phosphoesterase TrpH
MKIDLHSHTKERSGCGRMSEDELVSTAVKVGLDVVSLTDHCSLAPKESLVRLNDKFAPIRVLGGIELTVSGEDILVFGIHDKRLETHEWSYPELHAFARERGGFLVIAHPFRYRKEIGVDIEKYRPDAIEMYSCNTPLEARDRIQAVALKLDLPSLSNSDAHGTEVLGEYYNVLDGTATDEPELLQMLRVQRVKKVFPTPA